MNRIAAVRYIRRSFPFLACIRRAKKVDPIYKAARYQILLVIRLLVDPAPLPKMNSKDIVKRSEAMVAALSDENTADKLFSDAVQNVEKVAIKSAPDGIWTRD